MNSDHIKILLIEDNPDDVFLLKQSLLEVESITVTIVHSPDLSDGIKNLDRQDFDLILIDLNLPGSTGLTVFEFIQTRSKNLPVVVLTGIDSEVMALKAIQSGAQDYLVKGKNDGHEILRIISYAIERFQLYRELKRSEERTRTIIEKNADGILIVDSKGIILLVNDSGAALFGRSAFELIGSELWFPVIKDTSAGIEILRPDNTVRTAEIRVSELLWDKQPATLISIRDITERKAAEEKIKSLLTEKEVILKEVHHRIKNNMSTMKLLLGLHIDSLNESAAISALRDAQNRIDSVLVLYDKLYRSDNYKEMSVKDYIPSLADEVIKNFPGRLSVKVEKEIDDFVLNTEILQPLGIIINELLTNIMKYAFTGRDTGTITLSASLTGGMVTISVEDNGHGLPEAVDFKNSTGFGMELINMLTELIGGTMRIVRNNGTKFILEFDI